MAHDDLKKNCSNRMESFCVQKRPFLINFGQTLAIFLRYQKDDFDVIAHTGAPLRVE